MAIEFSTPPPALRYPLPRGRSSARGVGVCRHGSGLGPFPFPGGPGPGLSQCTTSVGILSRAVPVYHRWTETFPSDGEGFVGLDVPEKMLGGLVIVASIMAVNNGVGTVQDLPGIVGSVGRSIPQRRGASSPALWIRLTYRHTSSFPPVAGRPCGSARSDPGVSAVGPFVGRPFRLRLMFIPYLVYLWGFRVIPWHFHSWLVHVRGHAAGLEIDAASPVGELSRGPTLQPGVVLVLSCHVPELFRLVLQPGGLCSSFQYLVQFPDGHVEPFVRFLAVAGEYGVCRGW